MTRAFTVVLIIGVAVVWAGGCQEEQTSSDIKRARLIAAENRELKSQLKKQDDEIRNPKSQPQAEVKKRDDEIKNLKAQLLAETKKRDDEVKNLKAQFQTEAKKRDDEIKNLETQSRAEAKKREQLSEQLARCERIKEEADGCNRLVTGFTELVSEFTAENERLKAELAEIKGKPTKPQADVNE